MSEHHFTVILQPEEEGGFSVFVPAIPGCHTQGETEEEALQNAQEVILLCLEAMMDDNIPIPQESQPIIKTIKAFIKANIDKYGPVINKIEQATKNVRGFTQLVLDYCNAAKANGKDAEGNPVKEQKL